MKNWQDLMQEIAIACEQQEWQSALLKSTQVITYFRNNVKPEDGDISSTFGWALFFKLKALMGLEMWEDGLAFFQDELLVHDEDGTAKQNPVNCGFSYSLVSEAACRVGNPTLTLQYCISCARERLRIRDLNSLRMLAQNVSVFAQILEQPSLYKSWQEELQTLVAEAEDPATALPAPEGSREALIQQYHKAVATIQNKDLWNRMSNVNYLFCGATFECGKAGSILDVLLKAAQEETEDSNEKKVKVRKVPAFNSKTVVEITYKGARFVGRLEKRDSLWGVEELLLCPYEPKVFKKLLQGQLAANVDAIFFQNKLWMTFVGAAESTMPNVVCLENCDSIKVVDLVDLYDFAGGGGDDEKVESCEHSEAETVQPPGDKSVFLHRWFRICSVCGWITEKGASCPRDRCPCEHGFHTPSEAPHSALEKGKK
eukprot:TRINITY_DN42673_c0_g1_i1.p1 TRINITY_DN42673_c0_g1~~TRINITY_DN42673_c0_g1_i1.p1  ORF type:complete len:435 (-),score=60.71 TRINITY_DN42673_c0_g1_i1:6-1289(-)